MRKQNDNLREAQRWPYWKGLFAKDPLLQSASKKSNLFREATLLTGLVCCLAIGPHQASAQTTGNITITTSSPGDYKGYSIAPYSFVDPVNGTVDGHVAVGSRRDLTTSAHDFVNLVLLPDVAGSTPMPITSYNLSVNGATDVRAVDITNCGGYFTITLQVRGGGKKDRIAIITAYCPNTSVNPPIIVTQAEIELPDRNCYPTSADFDGNNNKFYISGFATDPSIAGYPHEPLLTDSKSALLIGFTWDIAILYGSMVMNYGLFDSPIPMNPPPPGTNWNGLYNDYDVAQHVRVKSAGNHVFLTGSSNGQTLTSWGGTPWPVNTSNAFMYDLANGYSPYNYSPSFGSNGDSWTLPEVLPNRLPTDPSGLQAVDAMLDASLSSDGFWVVQNRLDTTQWHLTHIFISTVGGVLVDTVSGTSFHGRNTLRDSLYKPAIVYGGQRFEYPISSTASPIGIYGKLGTNPFLISLDPYFVTYPYYFCPTCIPVYLYGAASSYNQFITYPTTSPDLLLAPHDYAYWLNSDCSIFNLPNSGTRFSVGSVPNYFAHMGSYSFGGPSIPRFIQGDDYGQRGSSTCYGAFSDITNPELLLGSVNVVRNGGLNGDWFELYGETEESGMPENVTRRAYPCDHYNPLTDPIFYRQTNNGVNSQSISISPNPAQDYINISWGNQVDLMRDQASITITDMLGKQVFSANANVSSGVSSRFELTSIAPGIYYVSCVVNGQVVKSSKLSILQ